MGTRLRRLRHGARRLDVRLIAVAPRDGVLRGGLEWADGSPVVASPRQILAAARPNALPSGAGRGLVATELEFIVFNDTYEEAWQSGYRDLTPANQYNVDYSMLGTARVEPLLRRHPQRDGRGRACGSSRQGRVQPRPARDRLPLHGPGRKGRRALAVQDWGEGDRRPGGLQPHLHGQVRPAGGQLLPHPHLASRRRRHSRCSPARAPHGLSPVFEQFMAGLLADTARADTASSPRTSTATSASSRVVRPDGDRLGPRQPDLCASASSATSPRCGSRAGCPAGTSTRTSPSRRWSPAACTGSNEGLELEARVRRQRLRRRTSRACRRPSRGCRPVRDERGRAEALRRRSGRALRQHGPGRAARPSTRR